MDGMDGKSAEVSPCICGTYVGHTEDIRAYMARLSCRPLSRRYVAVCGGNVKPSIGLEPMTPSLPWRFWLGLPLTPTTLVSQKDLHIRMNDPMREQRSGQRMTPLDRGVLPNCCLHQVVATKRSDWRRGQGVQRREAE